MINNLLVLQEGRSHVPVILLDPLFLPKSGYSSSLRFHILRKFILVKITHTCKPITFGKPSDFLFVCFLFSHFQLFSQRVTSLFWVKCSHMPIRCYQKNWSFCWSHLFFNWKNIFLNRFLVRQCHFLILFLTLKTHKLVFRKSRCFPDNNTCVSGIQKTHNKSRL